MAPDSSGSGAVTFARRLSTVEGPAARAGPLGEAAVCSLWRAPTSNRHAPTDWATSTRTPFRLAARAVSSVSSPCVIREVVGRSL